MKPDLPVLQGLPAHKVRWVLPVLPVPKGPLVRPDLSVLKDR